MTPDPSLSFADLLLWDLLSRLEVVFPVHQYLNHLVLELVSVVVSAVVPDSVQTLVVDVLVPVLARPVSSVVLFLGETAVVSELVLLAVSEAATDTVMVTAVFAEQAVVVAAVVSGPVVWVHHVWSVHLGPLLQFSSTFLASLALRVMSCVAVLLHI